MPIQQGGTMMISVVNMITISALMHVLYNMKILVNTVSSVD